MFLGFSVGFPTYGGVRGNNVLSAGWLFFWFGGLKNKLMITDADTRKIFKC